MNSNDSKKGLHLRLRCFKLNVDVIYVKVIMKKGIKRDVRNLESNE